MELMAGHEAGAVYKIGGADSPGARAQVRDCNRTRFPGVIYEIALHVTLGFLANDLDRVLIGAYGAVSAQAIEQRSGHVFVAGAERGVPGKRHMRHVIDDPERKVTLGSVLVQLVEHRLRHCWRELLRRKAVAAGNDLRLNPQVRDPFGTCLGERGHHVEVERFADGPWLLGSVEDGKALSTH